MDLQKLNDDRRMISGATKLNNLVDKGFSERAKSLVNTHAVIAGIALALPLMGFDNIIYSSRGLAEFWDSFSTGSKARKGSLRSA